MKDCEFCNQTVENCECYIDKNNDGLKQLINDILKPKEDECKTKRQ
tara:strand:+ start:615 stop:752 length:138 start_codon:yes stop_codon:yes gene_type:complete